MGMDAELLAIGKFSKRIAKHLDYPEDYYYDMPEGFVIITCVFSCSNTKSSNLLAEALGI